mmetsp:Transcript_65407/g.191403  ORF Transcript_65407/g.191403 Transcript_65407/m.191403 type:complete len:297 (+) Transcript_65407:1673-2563(+)
MRAHHQAQACRGQKASGHVGAKECQAGTTRIGRHTGAVLRVRPHGVHEGQVRRGRARGGHGDLRPAGAVAAEEPQEGGGGAAREASVHDEDLAVDHSPERQLAKQPGKLLVDHGAQAIRPPILREDLVVEAAAMEVHVQEPVLMVATLDAHRLRPHSHEGQQHGPDLCSHVSPVADVSVEQVSVCGGGHPKLVKYPEHVCQLPVSVPHHDQLLTGLVSLLQLQLMHSPSAVLGFQDVLCILQESAEVARRQRRERILLKVIHQLHCPVHGDDCLRGWLQPRSHVGRIRRWKVARPG